MLLYDVYYARGGRLSQDMDTRLAALPRVPAEAPAGSLAREVTAGREYYIARNRQWVKVDAAYWREAFDAAKHKREAFSARRR